MWAAIVAFIGGGIITAIGLFIRTYFTNKNTIEQLQDVNDVAADRIAVAEASAKAEADKRLDAVVDEAAKINATRDADAALDFLHKYFPKKPPTASS